MLKLLSNNSLMLLITWPFSDVRHSLWCLSSEFSIVYQITKSKILFHACIFEKAVTEFLKNQEFLAVVQQSNASDVIENHTLLFSEQTCFMLQKTIRF